MIDRELERQRALAAARSRKHRALRKRKFETYRVRTHGQRLAVALVRSGLSPADVGDHAKVEAALDLLVAEWVVRKLREALA